MLTVLCIVCSYCPTLYPGESCEFKVGYRKSIEIITGRPKAVVSLRLQFFCDRCCSILICFHFNNSCVSKLFILVWVTQLPLVGQRATNSPVTLLFRMMRLSVFPFDIWDKPWVLIRSVPKAS